MRRSPDPSKKPDWRAVIALTWAILFGFAYAGTIVRSKAPGMVTAIERVWNRDLR